MLDDLVLVYCVYDGNSLLLLSGCPPSTEILSVHQYYGCDLVLFRGPCSYLNVTCYSPPDPSFTCQSVLAALQTVWDRMDSDIICGSLESILNIPLSKKREVRMDSTSTDQYREKLIQYYIMTNPNASWDGLAGMLLLFDIHTKAFEKVKRNIIRTKRGTYLISVNSLD